MRAERRTAPSLWQAIQMGGWGFWMGVNPILAPCTVQYLPSWSISSPVQSFFITSMDSVMRETRCLRLEPMASSSVSR